VTTESIVNRRVAIDSVVGFPSYLGRVDEGPRTDAVRRWRWIAIAVLFGGLAMGRALPSTFVATSASTALPPPEFGDDVVRAGEDVALRRAEQVVNAILGAAPDCQPMIQMSGVPIAERDQFVSQARALAAAAGRNGSTTILARVLEAGDQVYGVLYSEKCGHQS
jgi:hypothetical protein